jgi:hypothetical protein
MTIALSDNTPRVSYTVASGITQTTFTVNFEFFDDSDLNFYVDGTLKTLATHYTVTGGSGSTGTITTTAGNEVVGIAGGSTVTITRDVELSRVTDFPSSGAFEVAKLNTELDRFTAIASDLNDGINRTIRMPDSDPVLNVELPSATARADKIFKFDTEGNIEAVSANELISNTVIGANYTNNTFIGDGSTVAYTTTVAAGSKNNCQIYIDGVYQEKSTFSISTTTLTFTEAPPLNSSIEVIIGNAINTADSESANVNYNQGGTGAQTRTVQNKLQEAVSVKDFGATGDGVTDDIAAIQAALDLKGSIYFPTGTYVISDALAVFSDTTIIMDGWVKCVGTPANFEGAFSLSQSLNGAAAINVTFLNPKVDGNSVAAGIGINVRYGAQNVQIIGAHIKNMAHAKIASGGYGGGRGIQVEAGASGVSPGSLTEPSEVVVTNFLIENCFTALSYSGNASSLDKGVVFSGGVIRNCESAFSNAGNSAGFPHDGQEAGVLVSDLYCYNCGQSSTMTHNLNGVFNANRGCNAIIHNVRVFNESTYTNVNAVFKGEMANYKATNIAVDGTFTYLVDLAAWQEVDALSATKYGARNCHFQIQHYGSVQDTVQYNYTYDAGLTETEGDSNPKNNYFEFSTDTLTGNRLMTALAASYPTFFLTLYERSSDTRYMGKPLITGNSLSSNDGKYVIGEDVTILSQNGSSAEGLRIRSLSPTITLEDTTASAHFWRQVLDNNKLAFDLSTDSGSSFSTYYELSNTGLSPSSAQTGNLDLGGTSNKYDGVYSNQIVVTDGITAPSTISGHAVIYVDTADGDLKVKFGDGTVKTIVTDT